MLEDRLAQPRIDLTHDTLNPGKRVGKVEDEQRAARLQDAGKFHERRPLVAARFVHVFEHAHADRGIEGRVGTRQTDGIVVTHVLKQRLADESGGGILE